MKRSKAKNLFYPCTNVEPPILPDYKKSPRLQFLDTGILNFDLNIQADLLLMKDLSEAYKGAIIPHIINQEVLSLNTTDYKMTNFWVRDKTQFVASKEFSSKHLRSDFHFLEDVLQSKDTAHRTFIKDVDLFREEGLTEVATLSDSFRNALKIYLQKLRVHVQRQDSSSLPCD